MAIYDRIGVGYTRRRATDPRIAAQLHQHLKGATRILNIGAGAGAYEPPACELIALEPSAEMIGQRPGSAAPALQGLAEQLPVARDGVSHVLTVLSMHHWHDLPAALAEINRVATRGFVALTWLPDAGSFWLTRDYFPEFFDADCASFPSLETLADYFDDVTSEPLLIPEDCVDGFLAAYWKRPEAYLEPDVRQSISSFARAVDQNERLQRLRADLDSGAWRQRNAEILGLDSIDAGYRIISARPRKAA